MDTIRIDAIDDALDSDIKKYIACLCGVALGYLIMTLAIDAIRNYEETRFALRRMALDEAVAKADAKLSIGLADVIMETTRKWTQKDAAPVKGPQSETVEQ